MNVCTRFILLSFLPIALFAIELDALAQNNTDPFIPSKELFDQSPRVEALSSDNLIELPVGIGGVKNNVGFELVITEAQLHSKYALFNAVARITLPILDANKEPTQLIFGAHEVKWSFTGGLLGDFRLMLLSPVEFPVLNERATVRIEAGFDATTGEFDPLSPYAVFDCQGFKSMGFNATLSFVRNVLIPLNDWGAPQPAPRKVETSFALTLDSWDDFMVQVNLPPFASAQHPDLGFRCQQAVLDLSVSHNAPAFCFPKNYPQTDPLPEMWRGVFIQQLEVICPPEFQLKDSPDRLSFQANGVLIDPTGVSAQLAVKNLLGLSEGKATDWDFSINDLHIDLLQSHIVQGGFSGNIVLPINDENEALSYSAIIDDEMNFVAAVQNDSALTFPAWCAEITLARNSSIELSKRNGSLYPEAHLYGSMKLNNPKLSFSGLQFQDLCLKPDAPRLTVGALGTINNEPIALGNLPISISELQGGVNNDEAFLSFKGSLAFMEEKISGNTNLRLSCRYHPELRQWKYHETEISGVQVEANFGECHLKGGLRFFDADDAMGKIYGKGFTGNIELSLFGGKGLNARGVFGRKEDRYFYTDLMATGLDIMLFEGLYLTGLGGGVYHNMQRLPPDASTNGCPSGINYVPAANSGFGIKFNTLLYFGSENVATGDVCLEMAFNENWGIRHIAFLGNAEVCPKMETQLGNRISETLNKTLRVPELNSTGNDPNFLQKALQKFPISPSELQADIKANFLMQYDASQQVFSGYARAYVTAGDVLRGSGPDGMAGNILFYFDRHKWFIHAGNPAQRVGLSMKLGPVNAQAGAYVMLGHDIPPFPDPPEKVLHYLSDNSQYQSRFNNNELSLGRGVALGAGLSVNTGAKKFLMLTGEFDADVGFDLMLKDLSYYRCNGEPVGLNGWYAQGQCYAYLFGHLGMQFDLFQRKRQLTIAEGAAGMLLEAGLPNPTWMSGHLAGHYNLLDGLVKGDYQFDLTLGEPCDLEATGSALQSLRIIAHSRPMHQEKEVDVYANPQVAFNVPYDKTLSLPDPSTGKPKAYRIQLTDFSLKQQNGSDVSGSWMVPPDKKSIAYAHNEALESQTTYELFTRVQFQEMENNQWVDIEGEFEAQTLTFTTGQRPENIPFNNVANTYPVIDQRYYLQGESTEGMIGLKNDVGYLLNVAGMTPTLVLISPNEHHSIPLGYNSKAKRIDFTLPPLLNEESYTLMVAMVPEKMDLSANLSEQYQQIDLESNSANTLQIRERKVKELLQLDGSIKPLLQYTFSTSRYNTLQEKLAHYRAEECGIHYPNTQKEAFWLLGHAAYTESFDEADLKGTPYSNNTPLIRATAPMQEAFFTQKISPIIYTAYPLNGVLTLNHRNLAHDGLPPHRAFSLSTTYRYDAPNTDGRLPFVYRVLTTSNTDYHEFQNQALYYYRNHSSYPPNIQQLRGLGFPGIDYHDYRIGLEYWRPDEKTECVTAI